MNNASTNFIQQCIYTQNIIYYTALELLNYQYHNNQITLDQYDEDYKNITNNHHKIIKDLENKLT